MADAPLSKLEQDMFEQTGEKADEPKTQRAVYKPITDEKIPISKQAGKMWKHRKDASVKRMSDVHKAWSEAIKYYNHDQVGDDVLQTVKGTRRRGDETENLVFSNTSTLMPVLYAKNPEGEFTNNAKGKEEKAEDHFANILERVVNTICTRKVNPGINLKSKVRRATLFALLCNMGWLKIGWEDREDSSEAVMSQIEEIAKEYAAAKEEKDLIELEGKMMALDEKFSIAQRAGPWLKNIHPGRIFVDPEAEDVGLSDCNWLMEWDFLPTTYIRAMYMEEGGKDDEEKLIYKPTHVLNTQEGKDDNLFDAAFAEINSTDNFKSFGFDNDDEFKANQFTKVWYVWDRLMQRVYLFHDQDWTWPLWVWNKPLPISRFYPYFCLAFHEGTENFYAKGEVTYYLDQQDAVNEINAEEAKARKRVKSTVLYNSDKVTKDVVDKMYMSADGGLMGIPLGQDIDIKQAIIDLQPPNVRFRELFDKKGKYDAVDRLTGINVVLRGGQLRTNTTEDAANMAKDAAQVRLDEKIDKIEELAADVMYTLAELCVQKLQVEDVTQLIGSAAQDAWQPMNLIEFNQTYNIRIVAGSTEKPTSMTKKKQAMEMGQVLGQFVNASPAVVMVILKVFEKAFSEVLIGEDDWDFIMQTIQASAQKGGPDQGAGSGAPANAAQGDPKAEAQQQQIEAEQQRKQSNPNLGDLNLKDVFTKLIKVLPPEIKQGIERTVQSGVNPADALVQMFQGGQQGARQP